MENLTLLGVDIAKNVFQLHGVDERGKPVLRRRLSRSKLVEFITNLSPCIIVMEACGGANYWYRKFTSIGHTVKLISPQFVKPFVKTNKSDRNDAEAICEAASRPTMRYVSPKSIEQQDIQAIHRIRSRLVETRTAVVNQIRGLLAEYGIIVTQGITKIRKALPEILEEANNELSDFGRQLFADLYAQLIEYDQKIKDAVNSSLPCLEAAKMLQGELRRHYVLPGVQAIEYALFYNAVLSQEQLEALLATVQFGIDFEKMTLEYIRLAQVDLKDASLLLANVIKRDLIITHYVTLGELVALSHVPFDKTLDREIQGVKSVFLALYPKLDFINVQEIKIHERAHSQALELLEKILKFLQKKQIAESEMHPSQVMQNPSEDRDWIGKNRLQITPDEAWGRVLQMEKDDREQSVPQTRQGVQKPW